MNDRERLIEIMQKMHNAVTDAETKFIPLNVGGAWFCKPMSYADQLRFEADYLISHGVTVQKHGRWISEKCNHKPHRIKNPEKWVIYKCSACGYSNGRKHSNYCPNCGAKMDGEADEH